MKKYFLDLHYGKTAKLILPVQFKKGTRIDEAIAEAWRLSARLDVIIYFEFNSHSFKIDQDLNILKIINSLENREEILQ